MEKYSREEEMRLSAVGLAIDALGKYHGVSSINDVTSWAAEIYAFLKGGREPSCTAPP